MVDKKVYLALIKDRIAKLQAKKKVSARVLSQLIGKGESYINNIGKRNFNPSINTILDLCNYFEIKPVDFFDVEVENPIAARKITIELQRLLGSDFDKLPDVLAKMSPEDVRSYRKMARLIGNMDKD